MDDPFYDYYNQLQNAFKENSGLTSNVDSTQAALNSVLLTGWTRTSFFPSSKKDEDGMENYVYFSLN